MFGKNLLEKRIKDVFDKNMDFQSRKVGEFTVFFIEGMVDTGLLSHFVIKPLSQIKDIGEAVNSGNIPFCAVSEPKEEKEIFDALLRGNAIVVKDKDVFAFDVRKTEKRSVEQPEEENSVKASKDSFVEELKTNISLLRKKIVSENLSVEKYELGRQTHTSAVVVYMKNIASDKIVNSIKEKLSSIDLDGVITPGVIEQYFSKDLKSFFPQTVLTERPDKACSNLLQGRVAVIVDGLPICYILPATVSQFLSTPEDYSGNFIFSSVVRLLRYTLISISIMLPGIYVALTNFHFEMLPPKLAQSIVESKTGVPFPVIIEIIGMLILFEVLVEAGRHMPQSSGQAVSIVGALVVGEAAISASLVSPAAVIIVAISVISSFAMPNQEFGDGLRLWRVIITIAGRIIGLFGVIVSTLIMMIHLARLESFGVPYLAPFAGVRHPRIKEALFIVPDKMKKERPNELNVKNRRRTK